MAFGETLVDQFLDRNVLGGAPFNVACHLAAMGLHPVRVTRAGKDELGEQLMQTMTERGLDMRGVQSDPSRPTGRVLVTESASGHVFDILPDQAYDPIHAGVLGIAIGFGAQSLVKDYFIGLFLLLEDQVRQGDVVEIAGKSGLVEEMTLRYIRLRDYEGSVHYVPNGAIDTVTNRSRTFAHAVIDVGVAYREDVDEVYAVMRTVAAELRADPEMADKIEDDLDIAGIDKWGDSAVVIRCRFKVKPLEQWGVRRAYLYRLKKAFDAAGIEIPYPHLTIYAGQPKSGQAAPLPLSLQRESD